MGEVTFVTASDGVKLAAHVSGSGPPLYAIHGGPAADHHVFGNYLAPIAEYRQLYLADQRGCGDSGDAPPKSYTLTRLAADIEEIRAHLGQGKIEVLGYSFGGLVALTYARRWAQNVNALMLVDSPVAGLTGVLAAPDTWSLWGRMFTLGFKRDAWTNFHLKYEVANREKVEQVREVITGPNRFDRARISRLAMAGFRAADVRYLSRAGVRLLGLYGKQDRRFRPSARYLTSARIQVERIDNAGHFPFIEQPAEFHRIIKAFLVGDEAVPRHA